MSDSTGAMQAGPVVGYHILAVEAWINQHVPGLQPPLAWTRLEGGHSNLTYLVEDRQGRKAVIRRPPMASCCPRRTTWRANGR